MNSSTLRGMKTLIAATLLTLALPGLSAAAQKPDRPAESKFPNEEMRREMQRLMREGIQNPSGMSDPAPPAVPAAPGNGGQCVITLASMGYRHTEIHRWEVTGAPMPSPPGKVYPVVWSVTGNGFSHADDGTTRRDAWWNIAASAGVQYRAFLRASDNKWVLQQAVTQARVQNGITGTQQSSVGGVASRPTPIGSEAFEWMYPAMIAPGNATTVVESGQIAAPPGVGFMRPAVASGTVTCQWNFIL